MKILRSTYGAAGIFFPIGKPEKGGTCEHASKKCLKECYALDKDYDEVLNIPEKDKREIHKFFIKQPVFTVCKEILKEMDELQQKILTWFASGDCLDKDTDRICLIMQLLDEEGVVQNGFTRNVALHKRLVNEKILDHFVLTVETLKPEDSPFTNRPSGLWGVPNYDKGVVELYYGELGKEGYRGSCGSSGVSAVDFDGKKIEIAANCTGCFYKRIGCFYIGK